MPNITRGGRINGLLAYLAGPAREGGNEHVDPHLVAGHDNVMAWHAGITLDRASAQQVAGVLDRPRRVHGTRVTVPVRRKGADGQLAEPAATTLLDVRDLDGNTVTLERPAVAEVRDADVWHCSLSLRAEEGQLSDEQWGQISEAFVAKMGFTSFDEPEGDCRWVALRHGLSKGGNDHVHVVVSLVHADGTAAKVWKDRVRAQQAVGELEQQFGLQVLESRQVGRGGRESNPAERGIAERRGRVETGREQLERTVRGCAAAAEDEGEFVRRVVRAGVRIRPRYAKGTEDIVEGYSVALRAPGGVKPDWYGGGRLARDLTLPRLRQEWPDSPQQASAAVAEWRAAGQDRHPVAPGRESATVDPEALQACAEQVKQLREKLRTVGPEDRATWAHVAHETAGAFAAWSLQVEPTPGPLAATAAALARSAQTRARYASAPRTPLPSARGAARLLASAARGGTGPVAEAVLLVQLANTARALHDAHLATGDAKRAAEIATTMRRQLAAVNTAAPERDVDGQATAAVRVARRGQAPIAAPTPPTSPGPTSTPDTHRPTPRTPDRPGPER